MDNAHQNWRQDDPRFNQAPAWPAEQFPNAEYRYFRDCGCLVCALAVMLRHGNIEKEEDERLFNPWILNERLICCGAFDTEADLELSDISRLYPLEYLGELPYSRSTLAHIAASNLPCLITVPGTNATLHFTALLHLTEDDAVVFDPCCGKRNLSSYKRIYEIRPFRPE